MSLATFAGLLLELPCFFAIPVLVLPEPLLPPHVDQRVQQHLTEGYDHVEDVPGIWVKFVKIVLFDLKLQGDYAGFDTENVAFCHFALIWCISGKILLRHPAPGPIINELEVGRLGEAVGHEGEHCGQDEERGQVDCDDGLELGGLKGETFFSRY